MPEKGQMQTVGEIRLPYPGVYPFRPARRRAIMSRRARPRSSMDRVPDFESVGWGFESLRGRHTCGGITHRHTYLWGFLYPQNLCWFFSGAVPVQLFGNMHLFFTLNYLLASNFPHI